MGAQCVKSSPRQKNNNQQQIIDSLQHDLRYCQQNLQFTMTIQHLRLTNMINKVKQIRFSLETQFEIVYQLSEFTIQQNLIKSQKIHKLQFQFPANCLNQKVLKIKIINFQSQIIQELNLRLTQLCTGPIHHDHLLKELKSRLMFDIHLYQNISVIANCQGLKIALDQGSGIEVSQLAYRLGFTTEIDQKTFISENGYYKAEELSYQREQIFFSLPNNMLKGSNFRIQILKNYAIALQFQLKQPESPQILQSIPIPYHKIQSYQSYTTSTIKQIDYIKKVIQFNQLIKQNDITIGTISFQLQIQSSTIYTQQMQCLILSQIGISSVSPTLYTNDTLISQLKQIYKSIKKISRSFGINEQKLQKDYLIKNIDEIYAKFEKTNQEIFTSEEELYERQITLVKLLNQLVGFFSQGEDILNERLWRIISCIMHKTQLSTRYLTLHQKQSTKKEVYLKYYKFIILVLQKIIDCTNTGITYSQLQYIQKFIAFAYFRFPWIQDKILNALMCQSDPIISQDKLTQYGVNSSCRSPSKSYVYDWQSNIFNKIRNQKQFQQHLNHLQAISSKNQQWDELLFNRNDQDLFYGLYLQIWRQAQITLNSYRGGKVLWEYFPNYGKLLSCFLGKMNNNNINDLSPLFKECSNKLVLNQKLLNTFVIQLFPKTYLYETCGVLKCLGLLESYFQVLNKQNKKLPHDFHFNYFYTGIKSILEQNHSYLVVKTLLILYKFYDLFSQDFKKTINNYLLSDIFYSLFLHWCINVRKIFYHLIHHKIFLKKNISNPQESGDVLPKKTNKNNVENNQNVKFNSNSNSKMVFLQEYIFTRKLNTYLRAIDNQCSQKNKEDNLGYSKFKKTNGKKISQQKPSKPHLLYHQIMKIKLQKRIKQKLQEQQRLSTQFTQRKPSQDSKTPSIVRKSSLFMSQNIDIQFYRVRKMSVVDEIIYEKQIKIQQKYKQYCFLGMKQYEQVRLIENSYKDVQKLAKLVQGDIDC